MFGKLKAMFAQVEQTSMFSQGTQALDGISMMADLNHVKANVPADAIYVTAVMMMVMKGQTQTSINADISGISGSVVGSEDRSMVPAYMLHNGKELMFIANSQVLFSAPFDTIENLQSLRSIQSLVPNDFRQGFVCNFHDGSSIIISQPWPVATDQNMHYATIGRMTDMTGGWAKQLKAYGVKTLY